MSKLLVNTKYSIERIAKELRLSTILANGIRNNFGDPISIYELKQISLREFVACKHFGRKRWYELQEALSAFDFPERSVALVQKRGLKYFVVEIDISIMSLFSWH